MSSSVVPMAVSKPTLIQVALPGGGTVFVEATNATDSSMGPAAVGFPTAMPTALPATVPAGAPVEPEIRSFAISLFEMGDPLWCFYSFFLPPIAMGHARHLLDGSNCCVTCFNTNPIIVRWLTRSAYNIPGSYWEDVFVGLLCPCCAINQIGQTTKLLGRPHPFVGPEFNRLQAKPPTHCTCYNMLKCCLCYRCAMAHIMQESMGMPYFLGLCCTSFCIGTNLLRYHYRLRGDDCGDCYGPYFICLVGVPFAFLCPLVQLNIFVPQLLGMAYESHRRGNHNPNAMNGTYLSPYRRVGYDRYECIGFNHDGEEYAGGISLDKGGFFGGGGYDGQGCDLNKLQRSHDDF